MPLFGPSGSGGLYTAYAHVQDQKATGTAGGSVTAGAWQTRTLNTVVSDAHGIITLAANQITLPAGTYRVRISVPAFACDRHKARLYNVTAGAPLLVGTAAYASQTSLGMGYSLIAGRFSVTAAQALEVQHQAQLTQAVNGLGLEASFGAIEVYTDVEIWSE